MMTTLWAIRIVAAKGSRVPKRGARRRRARRGPTARQRTTEAGSPSAPSPRASRPHPVRSTSRTPFERRERRTRSPRQSEVPGGLHLRSSSVVSAEFAAAVVSAKSLRRDEQDLPHHERREPYG